MQKKDEGLKERGQEVGRWKNGKNTNGRIEQRLITVLGEKENNRQSVVM